MKKDAFFFPHDSNAKDDPKCTLLIEELGLEGYGIFWVLLETLRDQVDFKYPLNLLGVLARKYNTTQKKIEVVIKKYGLFEIENSNFFYSKTFSNRMLKINQTRTALAEAGKRGAENREKNKQARLMPGIMPPLSIKEKERKEEESKEEQGVFSVEVLEEEQERLMKDFKASDCTLPENSDGYRIAVAAEKIYNGLLKAYPLNREIEFYTIREFFPPLVDLIGKRRYTYENIAAILNWAKDHNFWQAHTMSTKGLANNFEKMKAEYQKLN